MKATQLLAILAIILCFTVGMNKAHEDGNDKEETITKREVEATQRFARACNKRSTSACILQSEVTEGPYYYDTQYVRQDITEGYSGVPMTLKINVVDVNTCEPVTDAAVDVWHCNAIGVYSHYQNSNNNGGANTTFLRGIQMTDSNGNVSFTSIFPGWYQPRVIHIHVKVHIGGTSASSGYTGGSVVHTGQMFVADSVGTTLKTISPYSSNTQSLNTLSADSIYSEAGEIALMELQYDNFADGVVASITLGVDASASTTTTTSAGTTTTTTSSGTTTNGDEDSSASILSYSPAIFALLILLIL